MAADQLPNMEDVLNALQSVQVSAHADVHICCVNECTYSTTHVTPGHVCGNCGSKGHGQLECGKPFQIKMLKDTCSHHVVEHPCTAINCADKTHHTLSGHFCVNCHKFGHGEDKCPIMSQDIQFKCHLCRTQVTIFANQHKIVDVVKNCTICYDSNIDYVFSQCGHSACLTCIKKMMQNKHDAAD